MSSSRRDQTWREAYDANGYVVLDALLNEDELREVRDALAPLLAQGPSGRNDFEGTKTQRVYTLVARGKVFEKLVEHPVVLSMMDELLLPNYLLTANQAIAIAPGETPQPAHSDDAFYTIPRPRPAVSVSTMWAIDDFTEANGATQVIPGSHRWTDEELAMLYDAEDSVGLPPDHEAQLRPLSMRAGSCAVFAGTLVHRGAANRSSTVRRAISNQYCQPWARTQENFFLAVPAKKVAHMSRRLQAMLGYSIHPPFMGQVTARHPLKTLNPDFENPLDD